MGQHLALRAHRRSVQEVHLSHPQGRGRQRGPHDVDGQPLPQHLLEQQHGVHPGLPQPQAGDASWCSTPGWRTTPSTPTSSCPSTPSSKSEDFAQISQRLAPEGHRHRGAGHRAAGRIAERLRGRRRGGQEAGPLRGVHRRHDRATRRSSGATRSRVAPKPSAGTSSNEKGYYYIPTEDDWEKYPAGMRLFYEDPEKPIP